MAARGKARSKLKPARRKSTTTRASRRSGKAVRKTAKRRAAPARKPAGKPTRKAPTRRTSAGRAPKPAMAFPSGIGFQSQHMDYTSHDLDAIERFYAGLLGFSDVKRMTENVNYLAIQTGPSSSLGFMPPMPGPPEQWQPPREPTIYLFVSDVDRAHADLVRKGVSFEQAPQNMPWGHRVARLRDPEGRSVCLAQVLER